MDSKTILIVDDDIEFVQSIEELLTNEGFRVLKAHNGKEGLEAARKFKPDLMILDVMMTHDTEGFEVSRQIQKEQSLKDMKIIILTGITGEKNLPFKFEPDDRWLPVAAVLEKPVAPQRLLSEIHTQLGGNQ